MFSRTVNSSIRLKLWKTKPITPFRRPVETLENEADYPFPKARASRFRESGDIRSLQKIMTIRRVVEETQDVQQG